MGIKIKKQEDKIKELEDRILQLIEEMRCDNRCNDKNFYLHNRNKINEVQKLQKEFWKLSMQRDIPSIPEEKRNILVRNMSEYFSLGIEKGFFNKNNTLDVLKQLTLGNRNFSIIQQSDRHRYFGEWGGFRNGGTYTVNPDCIEGDYARHVVFHELSHCVTPDLGNYGPYIQEESRKSIFTRPLHDIIREIIAEYMACELSGGYKERTRISRNSELTSDWWTLYNRAYQQLGDEFLQTIPLINADTNMTDRDRFKSLTMMALNPNNQILKIIIDAYNEKNPQNGIEDLRKISRSFEPIYKQSSVTEQQVLRIREAMSEYMPENWRPGEYLDNVAERRENYRITPQEIAETSRHAIRINPGQVSKGVHTVGRIKIRNRADKDNTTRNK